MQLKINASSYKVINAAIRIAQDRVPARGIWLEFHREYGVGKRSGKELLITPQERITIAEHVKNLTDLDPRVDDYEKLSNMDRIQKSKITRFEKLMSLPPRETFLEVRILPRQTSTPAGFQGMLVDQFISLEASCIISVENFSVFANLQKENLECLSGTFNGDYHVVYVGDNVASPKAVKSLRELSTVPWINFGDFDPSGIHIGVTRLKADFLILPLLEQQHTILMKLNNSKKYEDQYIHANLIASYQDTSIKKHIDFILDKHIAIMQEQLISHSVSLDLVQV